MTKTFEERCQEVKDKQEQGPFLKLSDVLDLVRQWAGNDEWHDVTHQSVLALPRFFTPEEKKQETGVTTDYVKTQDVRNMLSDINKDGGNYFIALNSLANRGVELPIQVTRNDEAVELLKKVCEHVETNPKYAFEALLINGCMGSVKGLPEWWAKHKSKTEREEKLEKIIKLIQDCTHSENDGPKYLAERILEAIS